MICDTCGCANLHHKMLEGHSIAECQLCGELHGDPDDLQNIEEIREGDVQGYDREIYPLVKTITMITGFKVLSASAGFQSKGAPPFVNFKIHGPKARVWLEKVITSLMMANRELEKRWVVEVTLIDGLSFTLKPQMDCPPHLVDATAVQRARRPLTPSMPPSGKSAISGA